MIYMQEHESSDLACDLSIQATALTVLAMFSWLELTELCSVLHSGAFNTEGKFNFQSRRYWRSTLSSLERIMCRA